MATCPVSGAKRNTQLILGQAGEHGSLTIKLALHSVDLPKKVFQLSGHPKPDQDSQKSPQPFEIRPMNSLKRRSRPSLSQKISRLHRLEAVSLAGAVNFWPVGQPPNGVLLLKQASRLVRLQDEHVAGRGRRTQLSVPWAARVRPAPGPGCEWESSWSKL